MQQEADGGYNLFVSAYHGFFTLGNEHLPETQRFESFPPYAIELSNATAVDGTLVIPVSMILGVEPAPERYRQSQSIPQGVFYYLCIIIVRS